MLKSFLPKAVAIIVAIILLGVLVPEPGITKHIGIKNAAQGQHKNEGKVDLPSQNMRAGSANDGITFEEASKSESSPYVPREMNEGTLVNTRSAILYDEKARGRNLINDCDDGDSNNNDDQYDAGTDDDEGPNDDDEGPDDDGDAFIDDDEFIEENFDEGFVDEEEGILDDVST